MQTVAEQGTSENGRGVRAVVPALIVLGSTAWALCVYLGQYAGYIHFDTAEIFAWSRRGFALNTGRHPPLLPWLVHAVDVLHPIERQGLMLLAWANLTIGAWATWRVARLALGYDRAMLAMILYGLVPYATWLAMKFNHNAILISLWPLTVWAFLSCLRRPTLIRGVLLGLTAAVSVLAKYYTLLLLLAMLVASLCWPRRGELFTSAAPYAALAALVGLLAPHVHATYFADAAAFSNLFADLGYERRNPLVHALQPSDSAGVWAWLRMLRSNATSLLPAVTAVVLLGSWLGWRDRAASTQRRPEFNVLLMLVALPYLMTVLIVAILRLPASPEWAAPILSMTPVLLAGVLPPPSADAQRRLSLLVLPACLLLPLAGPISLYLSFRGGTLAATAPRAEIARDAAAIWRAATGRPLGIIGPEQALANTASLVLPERPYSWPAFDAKVPWITQPMVVREGVLVACMAIDPYCLELSKAQIPRAGLVCHLRHRRTFWGHEGPAYDTTLFLVAPKGRRLAPDPRIPECKRPDG